MIKHADPEPVLTQTPPPANHFLKASGHTAAKRLHGPWREQWLLPYGSMHGGDSLGVLHQQENFVGRAGKNQRGRPSLRTGLNPAPPCLQLWRVNRWYQPRGVAQRPGVGNAVFLVHAQSYLWTPF